MFVVDFISNWLKEIVLLFILITIIELVMPKGSMKKYVDLIIGFLIILTVLSPLVKISQWDFSAKSNAVLKEFNKNVSSNNGQDFNQYQEEQILQIYKKRIIEELKAFVETNTELQVIKADIKLRESGEDYGMLEGMEIILGNNKEDKENKKIHIEAIETISIKEDYGITEAIETFEYEDLRLLIANHYELKKDDIIIKEYQD